MSFKPMIFGALCACTLATAGLGETSQSQAEAAVKGRQAYMNVLSYNLGFLGGMAKGDTPYNADLAAAISADLVKLTDLTQAGFWPAGSSSEDVEGSRALPVAWTDFAATQGYIKEIDAAVAGLAEGAGTLEGLQAGVKAVGQTCSGCHQAMRAPLN